MRVAEGLFRLLYHVPLLGAAILLQGSLDAAPAAGLSFAIAVAYARIAALGSGATAREEAILLAETLPYLAFGAVFPGGTGTLRAFVATAEFVAAGAALLAAERFFLDDARRIRMDSLGKAAAATLFVAAAASAGFAIAAVRPAPFLGSAVIVTALCAYAVRRRA
jgi:hypothetical protein